MAVSKTARLGLTRWTEDTDPWNRDDFDDDNAALEAVVALYGHGTLTGRPAAGIRGRYYYATDTPAVYYDDGATWRTPFVYSTGDQSIAGIKTFTSTPTINGQNIVATNDARLATITQAEVENSASTAPRTITGQRLWQALNLLLGADRSIGGAWTFTQPVVMNAYQYTVTTSLVDNTTLPTVTAALQTGPITTLSLKLRNTTGAATTAIGTIGVGARPKSRSIGTGLISVNASMAAATPTLVTIGTDGGIVVADSIPNNSYVTVDATFIHLPA